MFCPSVTMMDNTAREDTEVGLNDDNTTLPAKFVIGASDEDFEEQAEYKEEIVVRIYWEGKQYRYYLHGTVAAHSL